MRTRVALIILLLLNGVCLLPGAIALVEFTGLLRRLDIAKNQSGIVDLIVENRAGKVLYVTPIGTNDDGSRLVPLPLVIDGDAGRPSAHLARFELPPGQRMRFTYPWWDHRHSHVVVETLGGGRGQVAVSPTFTHQSLPPDRPADVIVTSSAALPSVAADVQGAYVQALAGFRPVRLLSRWWILAYPTFLTLCVLLWRSRRVACSGVPCPRR